MRFAMVGPKFWYVRLRCDENLPMWGGGAVCQPATV